MRDPRRLSTLSDYAAAHRLTAVCDPCGREVDLDLPALIDRLGDLQLGELRTRLTCSGCGRRPGIVMVRPARERGPW